MEPGDKSWKATEKITGEAWKEGEHWFWRLEKKNVTLVV